MVNKKTTTGWNLDHSYAELPQAFFTKVHLKPVEAPRLVKLNHSLAASLGLNEEELRNEEGIAVLAGNKTPDNGLPIAQAYAGHQFGNFTMLGDGRALLHGEQITSEGKRVDIQLKGSGRTPYSRGGDGRAALRPMLREYIISEAMHGLGIPTTRSLAVVETGEPVYRETALPGAVLTRVASSHLRVGTFQYARNMSTSSDLKALADYALDRHFPGYENTQNRYLFLLGEVIKRQAELIAKWQLAGFIHGVMNTDNMAISGETIDYGPCAFMDVYDLKTVFSSIDVQGRYAYGNQPGIGGWNLARFAESLLPLIDDNQEKAVELAQAELAAYSKQFTSHWLTGMRAKLGLFHEESEDEFLIEELLELMQKHRADYTNTFRALTFNKQKDLDFCDKKEFTDWQKRWQARLDSQPESNEESRQLMKDSNPAVIPRNHRVEAALDAAYQGDYSVMEKLLHVLADPYAHTPEQEEFAVPPEPSNQPYRTYCGT